MAVFLDILGVMALAGLVVLGVFVYFKLAAPKHVAPPSAGGDDSGPPRRQAQAAARAYYEVGRDSTTLLREMLSAEQLSITIFPNEDSRVRARRLVERFDDI